MKVTYKKFGTAATSQPQAPIKLGQILGDVSRAQGFE